MIEHLIPYFELPYSQIFLKPMGEDIFTECEMEEMLVGEKHFDVYDFLYL
jgi:hypothetical protein